MAHINKHNPFKYVGRYDVSYTRNVIVEKWYHHKLNLNHNFNHRMQAILNLIRSSQESGKEKYDPSIKVSIHYVSRPVRKVLEQVLKCECHPCGDKCIIVWSEGAEI